LAQVQSPEGIMKHGRPGATIGLKLTTAERTQLVESPLPLPPNLSQRISSTPASAPLMVTVDDLKEMAGSVAAQANQTTDTKRRKRLGAILRRIRRLLDTHTEVELAAALHARDSGQVESMAEQAAALAAHAAQALRAAQERRTQEQTMPEFPLHETERALLATLPAVSSQLKKQLLRMDADFSVAQVAGLTRTVAKAVPTGPALQQVVLRRIAQKLLECLQATLAVPEMTSRARKPKAGAVLYQLKIILLGVKPPVWRRIQVPDCTLDQLHQHIQSAMGWANAHLHQFRIGRRRFADPRMLEEDFEEFGFRDSTATLLSASLPPSGKRFRFDYEYDLGDWWHHEVLFEGCPPVKPGQEYPVCVEGARACPPEDCGGSPGYADFLQALQIPDHPQHAEAIQWAGGSFDPEEFDPALATARMRTGPPEWRPVWRR
jgi:hypothetical protein